MCMYLFTTPVPRLSRFESFIALSIIMCGVIGVLCGSVLILLVGSSYFSRDTTIFIRGNGPHLVIMIHGFFGSPDEFWNLAEHFDRTQFTVYTPYCPRNAFMSLEEQAILITDNILFKYELLSLNHTKISFIGNSLGGLLVQRVAHKLGGIYEIQRKMQFENMITVVTPHLGLYSPFPWFLFTEENEMNYCKRDTVLTIIADKLRYYLSYIPPVGGDLRELSEIQLHMTPLFKKYSSYSVNGFDLNVPGWSADMGVSAMLQRSDSRIMHTRVTSLMLHSCGVPVHVESHWSRGYFIEWDMYTVPIGSLIKHGSVIGKYLNALWTWDRQSIEDSILHIRFRFDEPW